MLPPTKLSQVIEKLRAGDRRGALRIAARFPQLGDQKERITRGWQAVQSPDVYREMGHDPDALVADGVAALYERYEIPS